MEIRIWEVPKSEDFPEGVKYSMVYAKAEEGGYKRVPGTTRKEKVITGTSSTKRRKLSSPAGKILLGCSLRMLKS